MAANAVAAWRGVIVMDWAKVRRAVCDGRMFTETENGCRVLSDALMPSGALVYVHLQSRGDDLLSLHDGGAAFDELAREALEVRSLTGVRRLLADSGFRLTDDGTIWRDQVPFDKAGRGIAVLSDASVRAARYLLRHSAFPQVERLDTILKDVLKVRFPEGRTNFVIEGKHRQHTFDFGAEVGRSTILAQAVSPDASSVSAAVLKGIDAQQANGNVVPLFVYDPNDDWQSGVLGMLEFGGRSVSVEGLRTADLLAA